MNICFVQVGTVSNNIIVICRWYFIETLTKQLGPKSNAESTRNSTYSLCHMSFGNIINTHETVKKSVGFGLSVDDKRLPYSTLTQAAKSPIKHRFIAGSKHVPQKPDHSDRH